MRNALDSAIEGISRFKGSVFSEIPEGGTFPPNPKHEQNL
jgi:hypothetical protein